MGLLLDKHLPVLYGVVSVWFYYGWFNKSLWIQIDEIGICCRKNQIWKHDEMDYTGAMEGRGNIQTANF